MINLDYQTIQIKLFQDREAQKALSDDYFSLFEQWRLSQRFSILQDVGKAAVLDVLDKLNDDDITNLELYFQEKIKIERINHRTVLNFTIPLSDELICKSLCEIRNMVNISISRDDKNINITIWR